MKRTAIVVAVVAALVGAGATWSAMLAGADSGVTAVVGGLHRFAGQCYYLENGQQTFCSGIDLDIYLDAHGSGSGAATGTFASGTDGGTNASRTRITCMTVVGNRAVVGGFITWDTSNPAVVGDEQLFYVIDNGGPGNAPLDKMGAREIYTPDQFTPGFPGNCGPPTSTYSGYTDVEAGDASIHAGL